MIRLEQCRGCTDDFYNGRVNIGGGTRCWSAKDGRMGTRYRIGTWTAPTEKFAFTEVRVPSCYHSRGYAYYASLPDFVKREDVVRITRKRAQEAR